jgi:hypothetical protein
VKTIYAAFGLALVVLLTVITVLSPFGNGITGRMADGPVELSGAIRLADGSSRIPNGARVFIHPVVERDFVEATTLALELAPEGTIEAVVVDGEYRATLPTRGVFAVAVSAPGWSPYVTQLDLRQDTQHDVRLSAEGFSFALDLQDGARSAIAAAEVSVSAHHGQLISRTRADSEGRVSFKLTSGQYRFVFHAPGFVPHASSILVLSNEHRPLTLSRAATLDVKVAGAGGHESALAVVDGLGRLAALGRTKDAAARFDTLPSGQYQIWAGRAGLEATTSLVLSGGQAGSVELTLKEQSPIRVPLPQQSCAPVLTTAAPTQDGRILHYRLPFEVGESEGARWLTLNKPPLDLRAALRCNGRVAHFELPRSGLVSSELTWRSPHEVRGRVLAPDGRPLTGAVIWATTEPASASTAPWRFTTISRADGSFTVPGVPEGVASLAAAHPRLGRVMRDLSVTASAPLQELHFTAEYYVAGKVLDVGGAPVARATVAFASPEGGNASQTSDAQGAFRIGPLGADQGLLVAFVDGRLAHDKPLLVSAENRDHVSLILERPSPRSQP